VFYLLEIILIILLMISIITFFLIIGINNKKQAIQTFSIPFFIKSYSNLIDKEQDEVDKSFIEKLNDFFDDSDNTDISDDGNEDNDDSGDE
jgi:c-di-AMP phosphodiesterase-like protein